MKRSWGYLLKRVVAVCIVAAWPIGFIAMLLWSGYWQVVVFLIAVIAFCVMTQWAIDVMEQW